jgi:uncharacterized protein (UPF0276 family)
MAPLVGIGLDFHDSGRPSLEEFYALIRPKISHASIVALTSLEEARRFASCVGDLPIIHHLSNVAPANPDGVVWENLELQDRISTLLGAAWCNEDIGIWNLGPYNIPYFTPPPFEDDIATIIAANIRALQTKCSIPFLAEIPSCSFVVGRLTLGGFFSRIVANSGCELVLDVPHLYSYALFVGAAPVDILETLPLASVTHLHIAGGRAAKGNPWRYIDNHDDPVIPDVMQLMIDSLDRCPRVAAITYEIGPNISDQEVLSELDRINSILEAKRFRPTLAVKGEMHC